MQLPSETREFARHVRLKWLALVRRFAPTERQRLFGLTIVIGGLCGLAAVAFHLSIRLVSKVAIDRVMQSRSWLSAIGILFVPTLGGLAAGLLLQYVVPSVRGSGIPQIKIAYALKDGVVPLWDSIGKFVVSSLQIGTGSSLGREGPTVQICSGIASSVGRVAGITVPNLKRLLPVGAAAGIAAAFNAPIAAVTFTIEEIVGTLDQTVLSGVIIAAAVAAVVERSVLGAHPLFAFPEHPGIDSASSLIFYALLGILAAGVSLAFKTSLLGLRAWFRELKKVPPWVQPAIGGAVTGVLATIAFFWLRTSGITGGGYDTVSKALGAGLSVKVLIALCAMKLVATVFSYSSGGAGGIFAPALFIGSMLGGAVGALDVAVLHHPPATMGAFALVGMGATFAGIIRAPITSVLIIIEMTGGYSLALPLMIANMSAYVIARHFRPTPIYEALLEQDGVHLGGRDTLHPVGQMTVDKALLHERDFVCFPSRASAADLLKRSAQPGRQEVFPVLDPGSRIIGMITLEDLTTLSAENHLDGLITAADVMRPPVSLLPSDDLRAAFDAMVENHVRELPIVDAKGNLLGWIDASAIARAFIGARQT